jgi:hypothetical protein
MYSVDFHNHWVIRKDGEIVRHIIEMELNLFVEEPFGNIELHFSDGNKLIDRQEIECNIVTMSNNLPNWSIVGIGKDVKIYAASQQLMLIQKVTIKAHHANPIFSIQLMIAGVGNSFHIPNIIL